jgi:energy-coupling factor transport system permease protein
MLLGLVAVCLGVYGALDSTTPAWLGRPMLVVGVAVSFVAIRLAGRRVARTTYRPDRWRWPELVVAASGVLVGAAGWWMSRHQLTVAYPSVSIAPTVSLLALAAAVAALAGALCSPRPTMTARAEGVA